MEMSNALLAEGATRHVFADISARPASPNTSIGPVAATAEAFDRMGYPRSTAPDTPRAR